MNVRRSVVLSVAVVTLLLSLVVDASHSAPRISQPVHATSLRSLISPAKTGMEEVDPPVNVNAAMTGDCAVYGADISWSEGYADSGVGAYALYINGTFWQAFSASTFSWHDNSFSQGGVTTYYGIATISNEDNYSSVNTTSLTPNVCNDHNLAGSKSATAVKADFIKQLTHGATARSEATAKYAGASAVN